MNRRGAAEAGGAGRLLLRATVLLPALAVAMLALAGPGAARAQGTDARADSILRAAAGRYDRVHSFCADFTQERIVPLLHQTTRSQGTLCEMQPAYFSMDFSQPEGDRVVADGRYLWAYYPSMSADQVFRTPLDQSSGGALDFQREFLEDAQSRFQVTYQGRDTVTGRPTHVLDLVPREPRGYTKARIWVEADRGLIRKVEITEENGSLRRVVLSHIRLNPALDRSRFRFTPPKGARILERGSGALPGGRR